MEVNRIDDSQLPGLRGDRYPRRLTFCVDEETFNKFEYLRFSKKVRVSVLLRELVEGFLVANAHLFEEKNESELPSGK